ncbi:MAG TPA: M23 family metallopeptidase [Acidimicrobiales bacterium]
MAALGVRPTAVRAQTATTTTDPSGATGSGGASTGGTTTTTGPPPGAAPGTTTTAPPPAPTTTAAPAPGPAPTTTTPTTTAVANGGDPSRNDPLAGENDPPVAVPTGVVPVPPRAVPRAPTPVDVALAQALAQQAAQAEASANAADVKVAAVEAKVADVQRQVDGLRSQEQDAIWKLAAARTRLVRRAVAAYVGGSIAPLGNLLQVRDINELDRDLQIENEASRAELASVRDYEAARKDAGSAAGTLTASMDNLSVDLGTAQTEQAASHQVLAATSGQVAAANVDPSLVLDGFVFPVLGPHKLDRNFGEPRNLGTPYFHLHQGDDVEAPQNAPLVAVVRGAIVNISSSALGGNGLWIQGSDGTKYYYAHLAGYAPDMTVGQIVEAGQLVGFVGSTGDATGPHLHFEVHPNGGPAIDPWSLLDAIDVIQAETQTSDAPGGPAASPSGGGGPATTTPAG